MNSVSTTNVHFLGSEDRRGNLSVGRGDVWKRATAGGVPSTWNPCGFGSLVGLERVATAAAVRTFEQCVERKMLAAQRGVGDGKSIQGRCTRAGEFEKNPTKFLLELGRVYFKKLLGPPRGGRERVGYRLTQLGLVGHFTSKGRASELVLAFSTDNHRGWIRA